MRLFQNLILYTNRYGNLQEMLEMASFLKYVDLYLTSEWGWLYVGHSVLHVITWWLAPLVWAVRSQTQSDVEAT
jgi:hypothetical protein